MKIIINSMKFKDNEVFNGVNVNIENGKVYALVGKNGTGKSTLFKLLSGAISDFEGNLNDFNNSKISSLIDKAGGIDSLTGAEFASYFLSKEELKNFDEYKKMFEMDEYFNNQMSSYSLGMRKKVMISLTLAKKTDIVLLDEPFNGLDSNSKNILFDLINREKGKRTIIISSHDFHNIHRYADELILIKDKNIISKELLENIYKIEFTSVKDKNEFLLNTAFKTEVRNNFVLVNIESHDKKELLKELTNYSYETFQKEDFNYDE